MPGVSHLVVVTSALVYGAWPTNPVPLTDDAPCAPTRRRRRSSSARSSGWSVTGEAQPSATVIVLRPAVPVAEDAPGWLASMLAAVRGVPVGEDDPPAQFLHLDLASAVSVALSPVSMVPPTSPDGWITGEELRGLAGGPRVRLPWGLGEKVTS